MLPWGPQQPQNGAGVRAGEAAACPCALSGSTWRLAEPGDSAPLRCTCVRCTGAEGNRFPSVSCAAAEPCAGPAQRPVPALPCAAATSAPALTGGEFGGHPFLPAAPDAHLPGGRQPAAHKVACPRWVNL